MIENDPITFPVPARLFATLEDFGERPCLLDPSGTTLSYAEVAARADALYAGEDVPRQGLAFVKAHDTVEAVLAYVGAVRRGLAVHLLDPSKEAANARLVETYAPDILADTRQAAPLERFDRAGAPAVHPELCILLSTSGSTGTAKLVKLTHRNITSNTAAICQYLGLGPEDRGITSLRFFYSYGMSVLNTHLTAGASLVVTDLSVEDPRFWTLAQETGVTNVAGVPFSFELMHRANIDLSRFPRLRILTQAGGRLSPELVRHFAETCAARGIDFYVMYGQTEAGPRMSYLPSRMAAGAPGSIGRAIPGGALYVVDDAGLPIAEAGVSGELVYKGPNVMAGYAENRAALASLEPMQTLHTGDIAHFDAAGLFYIDGRRSRFVKPFGLRVSLDAIEEMLRERHGAVAVTGNDRHIVIALDDALDDGTAFVARLAERLGLPPSTFVVAAGHGIPRLPSGKVDYKGLLSTHLHPPARTSPWRIFLGELSRVLLGGNAGTGSALDAFRAVLGRRVTSADKSFRDLGGNSMAYIQLYLLLEEYLGEVPEDWAEMSIAELEHYRGASFV